MNISSRFLTSIGAVVMAAGAVLFAQSGDATNQSGNATNQSGNATNQIGDAAKVMADMRQALGGEKKLAAVKTLTAVGKNDRAMGERSISGEYEMALELPDRFFTKQVMAETPMGNVSLTIGFNGSGLIQDTEMPQSPGGGGMGIMFGGAASKGSGLVSTKRVPISFWGSFWGFVELPIRMAAVLV